MKGLTRHSNVCQNVSNRTGVPYVVVKTIMRAYLHHLYDEIRRFILYPNYYFKVVPDKERLGDLKEVELDRAIRYYRKSIQTKKKRHVKLVKSFKSKMRKSKVKIE